MVKVTLHQGAAGREAFAAVTDALWGALRGGGFFWAALPIGAPPG